jgi:hypothetical protein
VPYGFGPKLVSYCTKTPSGVTADLQTGAH